VEGDYSAYKAAALRDGVLPGGPVKPAAPTAAGP
jgi:hypothetical protein